MGRNPSWLVPCAWAGAAAGGAALAAPAVWREPLHTDELVTLTVAPHSLGRMLDEIFVEKGGAPLHFLVERVTLQWPGGLAGLRLPSLLAFMAAVVLTGLVARALVGPMESMLAAAFLAAAPLAVELATFGRMYTLFLALFLAALLGALHAAARDRVALWLFAGALLGSLVYVHPIAPLYAGVGVLVAASRVEGTWRHVLRCVATAAAAGAVVALPYYAHAIWRLRDRYYVGYASSERLETTGGRSVPEESLLALTPGSLAVGLLVAAGAGAGLWVLARRERRTAAALAAWLLVPVAFFALVPAGSEGGTRFYARYLLPALPALALLLAAACAGLGLWLHRPVLAAALGAALVVGLEVADDAARLRTLHGLRLTAALAEIAARDHAVVFAATGQPLAERPSELLDELVELEVSGVRRVPGRARSLAAFIDRGELGEGVWLYRGPPGRVQLAMSRLSTTEDVEAVRVSPTLLVVHSATAVDPRALVRQSVGVRRAWSIRSPADRENDRLRRVEEGALVDR